MKWLGRAMQVYVDASGDSGTLGKGTRWLILAAVADLSPPGELERCLREIRRQSIYPDDQPIHFTGRPHVYKRAVLERLVKMEWSGIVVVSDTTEIRPESARGLAVPQRHYNYALSYVLERASQLAKARGEQLDFIIEESGNFSLPAFTSYVERLQSQRRAVDFMEWSVIDLSRIRTAAKGAEHLLSAADGLAHSFYQCLEPDRTWGSLEACYARIVAPRLLCGARNGKALRRGFTFMPTPLTGQYLAEYPELAALVV